MVYMRQRSRLQQVLLILLLLVNTVAFAQNEKTVTGVVTDATKIGIPGVSIMEEGTTNGTITNMDGEFTLNVKDNSIITVSFIGFTTQTIAVSGKTNFEIVLKEDVQQLDQVVVVGYGTKSVKDVTGSVATVKTKELVSAPVANFDQALSGRMAGVQVNMTDAQPGNASSIVIRGGTSLTGSNDPLYVVDGIPMENFNPGSINARDIESFSVLKDASATAIYGSRGANGVIIINTKGGVVGPTVVDFNASVGVQWIPETLDVMKPYDFVLLQQEVAKGKGDEAINEYNNTWGDPEQYRNAKGTNWQDEIFKTAIIQNYNASVSGGTEKTKHNITLNYLDQEGTLMNTGYEKYNGKVRLDHNLSDKIKTGVNINYSKISQYGVSVASNSRLSVLKDAWTFRPIEPVTDDGLDFGVDPADGNQRYNPVKTLSNTQNDRDWSIFRTNAYVEFELLKGLKFKTTGGYVNENQKRKLFYSADTKQAKRDGGIQGSLYHYLVEAISSSNILTYDTRIDDVHKINALVGYEYSSTKNENFMAGSQEMPLDNLGVNSLQIGNRPSIPTSYKTKHVMQSYFGRLDYSFNEKYLFTASYRIDGTSRFLGSNRWGYFPSASVGWRASEEAFIKDLGVFSDLKLRAGWGTTGNNRVPNEAAYSRLVSTNSSGYTYGGSYRRGFYINDLADADMKWETTHQYNVGLDLGFLDNKLAITVDGYLKQTKDLLMNAPMAPSTSFSSVWTNVGEIENKGIEVSINSRNINRADFTWSTNINISMNKNEVTALTGGATELLTDPQWHSQINENQFISRVGGEVGQFYGLISDGLYQESDFDFSEAGGYVLKDGIPDNGSRVIPGSAKFKDLNNDGTINEKDRAVIGSARPKHFGGITNNFRYKQFDLSVFFQWSYGNDILNVNKVEMESPTIRYNYNYFESVADRYTADKPTNDIHVVRGHNSIVGLAPNGNRISDKIVEDGSYLKLKTINLGYNFSENLLNRTFIKQARVYVSAQNLWTLTNYSGYDPEVSVGRKGALTPGMDYSAYPASTTVTFGVDLKF